MEPDGEVVDHDEEGSTKHGTEQGRAPDVAVEEDARRHSSILLLPPLHSNEAADQKNEDDEKSDDAAVTPRVLASTPLQSKQQADDGRQEERGALEVEFLELLHEGGLGLCAAALNGEEGDDERSGDGAEGKVDEEAPAPCEMISEGSAHQRSSHRRDAVHATNDAHVGRALAQRDGTGDDEDGSAEDTGGSYAGDGAADDQSRRVGRNAADQGADLEDEESDDVDPFDGVVGVKLSVEKLGRTGCQEVSRTIPTHVVERLELICDLRDGSCDDGVVLLLQLASCLCCPVQTKLTKAMQKTERHNAIVIIVSFHLVGYSKSSSSSLLLAFELRFSLT